MIALPFRDRLEAGNCLARELAKKNVPNEAIVLAIPRGGVVIGSEVARELRSPLDVIVARKIGVPWQPELAIGAIAGSAQVLEHHAIRALGVSGQQLEQVLAQERREMRRREDLYRGPVTSPPQVLGRTAILVDDGLATGWTMMAAARYVRSLSPKKIISAVPVGSATACKRLAGEVDDCVCLAIPEHFFSVQQWYETFGQVSDPEVEQLLAQSSRSVQ
jgi:putative phosphoribosyl transferase